MKVLYIVKNTVTLQDEVVVVETLSQDVQVQMKAAVEHIGGREKNPKD